MTRRLLRTPTGPLDATVTVPGSKSVANRALVCAALADGTSVLSGVPDGDDTSVVVDVLFQMGRAVLSAGGTCAITGAPNLELPGIVDAKLAGTSSRFLTAVAALDRSTTIIDGDAPLRGRPMGELHHALEELGAIVTPLGEPGHLPVSVSGGSLEGGTLTLRGDVSSQFISALMLIGPMLGDGIAISVDGPLVSRSYVEMTARVMRDFGATVDVSGQMIEVSPGGYRPRDFRVEPDFSSAAFPLCAVSLREGRVRIPDLASSRLQGDSAILDILRTMGVTVELIDNDVVVSRDPDGFLSPIEWDMSDCSDLVPVVAVASLAADGVSTLDKIGFIRNKESDRIGDLASEIAKIGGRVEELSDGLRIHGDADIVSGVIDPHHDHRVAMALALASLCAGELTIEDSEVVSKSWPTFFEDMREILGPSQIAH